jgi:phosphatidylglycerol:prolipoprotein diacylglycerol transferase
MHREIITIGAFKVHSYGFMLCIAFILAILITYRHLKKHFVDPYAVYDMIIAALVGGILGARIFYIIGNWSDFSGNIASIFKFWEMEGLVFYGGLLLGALAVIAVIRIKGLPLWIVGDAAGFSLALGLAVTRIGCFLNGCCFGKPSGLPWAITFPRATQAFFGMPNRPLHPTQIYESLLDMAIFIFLVVIYKRLKYHGEIFFLFLALYGLARFFVEFYRFHTNPHATLVFQILSLVLTAGAGVVLLFRRRLLPEVRP